MTDRDIAADRARRGRLEATAGTFAGVLALVLSMLIVVVVALLRFSDGRFGVLLGGAVDIGVLREVLFLGMAIAGGLAVANLVQNRGRWLNGATVALILLAVALGGHRVPIGDLPAGTPYLGLDRFALNLIGSSLIFIAIEKLFPLRVQNVLRPAWLTDSTYLIVNHILAGLILIPAGIALHGLLGWMVWPPLRTWVGSLPFFAQLLLALLVIDTVQYWTHRAFHKIPLLWRVHAIHHSIEHMDWVAGSRMHLFELIPTVILFLLILLLMGFDPATMGAYFVVAGFQTVFNHANLKLPAVFVKAPLKWLIVTPDFHHWHHTVEPAAIDHNYASHFPFLDYLFGTAVKPDRFPDEYGVIGRYVPPGFARQQVFPFSWRG